MERDIPNVDSLQAVYGMRFPMEDAEFNSLRQHFLNNLKMTFGSEFDDIVQEFTDATTLEDKMKVAAKFESIFGPASLYERLYKDVENKTNFKCPLQSEKLRNLGNEEYQKRNNMKALRLYSESIAYAPLDSVELALAYANRSAVLRSMQKCRECLVDIERALRHGYPTEKSFKLLLREMQCHRDMGNIMKANISCVKAVKLLNSLTNHTEEQIGAMKQQLNGENLDNPGKAVSPVEVIFPTEVPELSYGANPEVVGASSAVTIEYNEQQGRHLVATRDINIGDVLLIAENLVVTVQDEHKYDHCTHCHKLCFNLMPCSKCHWMMFCSLECKTEADQKYHNVECVAYSRYRYINRNLSMDVKDVNCRVIRLFSTIGLENLEPYFKYARTNFDESGEDERFHSKGNFNSPDFDTIFNFCSSKFLAVQTDLLMASNSALQVPRCFGLPTEHPDFFVVAGLYVHLEFVAVANCPSTSYTNFTQRPMKSVQPALCFNPLKSLINHSCHVGNVMTVHFGNKQVIMAKWPIKKGAVLTEPYIALHHEWCKEKRQEYLKVQCAFDCRCIVCEQDWDFIESKHISDPTDQQLASELSDYNENIVIDIHRCFLRNVLTSELEKFVKDRKDLLTKLWNKGEFLDVRCLEMQNQLEVYQLVQGNRVMYMIDYSQDIVQDPKSVHVLMKTITMRNPPKNIDFTDY